jgi:hypothetical protein
MTFPELLAHWQQCHTLECRRSLLTWITRSERETAAVVGREPARATKRTLSSWLACCCALACEATTGSEEAALCLPESRR